VFNRDSQLIRKMHDVFDITSWVAIGLIEWCDNIIGIWYDKNSIGNMLTEMERNVNTIGIM